MQGAPLGLGIMGLIVQKYGGTSVKDSDRIGHVADRILATKKDGSDVVVGVAGPDDPGHRGVATDPEPRRERGPPSEAVLKPTIRNDLGIIVIAVAIIVVAVSS